MKLNDYIARTTGQKTLIEAKMKEFEGLLLVGNSKAADAIREETHTLLDSYFDSQGEFVELVKQGKFQ